MAKELNELIVREIDARLADMSGGVLIDYARLNSEQTAELRGVLRADGVRMTVLRNRLAKIALGNRDDVPSGFSAQIRGPVAILFGEDGPLTAAKILQKWQKQNKGLAEIRGGLLEGKVLSVAEVGDLANIPDKETLRAQAAGMLLSPLQVLASAAQSLTTHFASCVKSRHEDQAGEA